MARIGWHALRYSEGHGLRLPRPSEYLRACHPAVLLALLRTIENNPSPPRQPPLRQENAAWVGTCTPLARISHRGSLESVLGSQAQLAACQLGIHARKCGKIGQSDGFSLSYPYYC